MNKHEAEEVLGPVPDEGPSMPEAAGAPRGHGFGGGPFGPGMRGRMRGGRPFRMIAASILISGVLVSGSIVFLALYRGPAMFGGTGAASGGAAATVPAGGTGATAPATASSTGIMTIGSRDAILGNANAPVTLVEYGDYQCPFCVQFFSQTEPQIVQNYINAGKVRMVFRDFAFLGPESIAAANAAQCANDQGKLWAYHNALYAAKVADEQSGGSENDGFYSRAEFLKLAQQVGLNISQFTSCIDGNKDASVAVQEKNDGIAGGVNSTPTFFVNGTQVLGAQPYATFQSAIDAALKSKG